MSDQCIHIQAHYVVIDDTNDVVLVITLRPLFTASCKYRQAQVGITTSVLWVGSLKGGAKSVTH